jgi:hypothetical protein
MTFAESTLERQPPPAAPPPTSRRLPRIVRGRPEDPRWVRPALLAILAGTALLYLWNLSSSGYANDFYAAASQSGGKNWTAWFFGSLDPSNAITVDKPPASLWVSGLSVRLFGLSAGACSLRRRSKASRQSGCCTPPFAERRGPPPAC